MPRLRARLSWMLASWLVLQLAAIAVPVVLAATGHATVEELCDCPGIEHGATCPMHHGPSRSSDRSDEETCTLRSACASPDAALLSLAGGIGVLPRSTDVAIDLTSSDLVLIRPRPLFRSDLPEAPPPRV